MTTFRHRILPQLATVAMVGATLAVGTHMPQADAQQLQAVELPSPGIIRAVAHETARSGWPHRDTGRERDRITRRVMAAAAPVSPTTHRVTTFCEWSTPYVTPARCWTRVYGTGRSSEQVVRVIVTRVRIFEDGSWRQWAVR